MITKNAVPRPELKSDPILFEHLSLTKNPLLRVFCFPFAGGTADVYRSWQQWFGDQLDICLVHLPGRGRNMRERAYTRVAPLVMAAADCIDRQNKIPYVLYGHSMGALISFELSRELFRRHGKGPEHLFVSGRRAPQYIKEEPTTFDLPRDEFISELKRLNGTPPEVFEDPELIELFINVLRADFETVETYEYCLGEPLSCPITVYGGLEDQHVPVESCHAWQQQTSAKCTVRMFKGDHFFIRHPRPDFINAFRSDVLNIILHSRTGK